MPTTGSQRAQQGPARGTSGPGEEGALSTRLSALIREVAAIPEAGSPAAAWDQVLHPGAVVGRFELLRELGRGGFGVVYEAKDLDHDRLVAFKAVLPGRRMDEAFESLQREAEALGRLAHPNIVTLHDAGRGEQGPWLSMELLRGQTLSQRLALGPVPVPEAVRVAAEVARGLAHAHAQGVVHRDLSPRNVFLCHDGQVKLLDLGLAHVFGRRRMAGGTPSYVAPEQWREAPEDERTDVFSLGVMLFRMLTGEYPTPADGGTEARPVPVVEVAGAPALGPLLARMLAQDPVERPRDAGEVLKALEAFRGELDRSPTTASLPPTLRRRVPARTRRALAGALLVLLLAVAGLAGSRWWLEAHRPPPSIAVLPFEDLSPERDQSMFAEGLAEEVLGALGSVEGLRVAGRTSSFSKKWKGADLAEVGRTLGVGAVLEGSVRRQGSRLKVVAQVVSLADGMRLWGRTFDREVTDVFEVQEEIAAAVVQALEVKVVRREAPAAQDRATVDPEGYTQYLRGREELRVIGPGAVQRAAEAFERAVALAPGFAPAWAGLARALHLASGTVTEGEQARAQRQRALEAAERAVTLAPTMAEGLAVRGHLRLLVAFDPSAARADLERAVALNPNDPATRARYSYLLMSQGQAQAAVVEARAAAELDPLANWWTSLGSAYVAAGELGRAEAAYRRQLEVTPDGYAAPFGLMRLFILQRRAAEALATCEGLPDEAARLWGRALVEHLRGDAAASDAALQAFLSLTGGQQAMDVALVHAFRGEHDQAFAWLDRSIEVDEGSVQLFLRTEPFFDGLRGDPRFAALRLRVEDAQAKVRP